MLKVLLFVLIFNDISLCLEANTHNFDYDRKFPRLLLRQNSTPSTVRIKVDSFVLSTGQEIQTSYRLNFNALAKNLIDYCGAYLREKCFSDVETLDFTDIKLKEFPSDLMRQMFGNVKHLNVSRNLIGGLAPHTDFASMLARDTLHTLDLSSNQLATIDEETFKHLKNLKHLNLANNKIKFINLFAFTADTHNLVELDLSRNLIVDTSMEFLLFSSLSKLKYLNLNQNRLTTLSNHLLYNLYSLEYLSLNRNNLKTFDLFSLSSKTNEFLKIVDLSFNSNLKLVANRKIIYFVVWLSS